ncbi:hypothetical protein [Desulfoluna sp.]|nr:hypothetical protein [Desulfoluna sp.]
MKFTETYHDYIESDEEREEGHIDVRTLNHLCEDPTGCDLGIDVAG